MLLLCALVLGFVSGLRTMLAPAAVSWAVRLGGLQVAGTSLAFMGYRYAPILLTLLAIGELIADKLPFTPSRKTPPQFLARILSGSLVGATIGASHHLLLPGLLLGILGAAIGTFAGAAARQRLANALHRDLPAALAEDVTAILIALVCVSSMLH